MTRPTGEDHYNQFLYWMEILILLAVVYRTRFQMCSMYQEPYCIPCWCLHRLQTSSILWVHNSLYPGSSNGEEMFGTWKLTTGNTRTGRSPIADAVSPLEGRSEETSHDWPGFGRVMFASYFWHKRKLFLIYSLASLECSDPRYVLLPLSDSWASKLMFSTF